MFSAIETSPVLFPVLASVSHNAVFRSFAENCIKENNNSTYEDLLREYLKSKMHMYLPFTKTGALQMIFLGQLPAYMFNKFLQLIWVCIIH